MHRKLQNRVTIRPPTPGDCAAFLAAVRRSRELHRPWITPKPTTPKVFKSYLERFSTDANHGFLVVHRATGDLVGVINLNNVTRGAFQNAALG